MKLLDSSLHQVVPALIEQGLSKKDAEIVASADAAQSKGESQRYTLDFAPRDKRKPETAEPEQRSNAAKACFRGDE